MNNDERDELAELFDEIAFIVRKADRTERLLWDDAVRAASAVRAAGYRKLRTITTVEELDTLTVNSVVRDDEGYVWDRWGAGWDCAGSPDWSSSQVAFPAIVLWEPTA